VDGLQGMRTLNVFWKALYIGQRLLIKLHYPHEATLTCPQHGVKTRESSWWAWICSKLSVCEYPKSRNSTDTVRWIELWWSIWKIVDYIHHLHKYYIADAIEKLKSVRLTKLSGYVAILVDSNGIMLVDHTSMVYEVFNRSTKSRRICIVLQAIIHSRRHDPFHASETGPSRRCWSQPDMLNTLQECDDNNELWDSCIGCSRRHSLVTVVTLESTRSIPP
jgi:hypothetical protein